MKETINQWIGQPDLNLDQVKLKIFSETEGKNSQVLDALIALNIGGKAGQLTFFREGKEGDILEFDSEDSSSNDFFKNIK